MLTELLQVPPRFGERFWPRLVPNGECLEWSLSRTDFGYGRVFVQGAGVVRAHRVAWVLTVGPIGEGVQVLHACDNPPCCRPDHLFSGTQADNIRDAIAKRRFSFPPHKPGDKNGASILTEAEAWKVKQLLGDGILSKAEIARCFEVSPSAVADIDKGRSWGHL
jgi:hypothetical protein